MCPFALPAEEAEDLNGCGVRAAEPMRHPGIELGRLARGEYEILFAEYQSEPPAEYVDPFIALMGLRLGNNPGPRE
jgi:hypothetical protein